jgi:hypothetical protein
LFLISEVPHVGAGIDRYRSVPSVKGSGWRGFGFEKHRIHLGEVDVLGLRKTTSHDCEAIQRRDCI